MDLSTKLDIAFQKEKKALLFILFMKNIDEDFTLSAPINSILIKTFYIQFQSSGMLLFIKKSNTCMQRTEV